MNTLGVYIHLPYCIKKCPYCDFNSYGVGEDFPEKEYIDYLIKEIDLNSNLFKDRVVDTVFFGGGTPSLFSPKSVSEIINKLVKVSCLSSSTEITLEINPKTSDLAKLKDYYSLGVNRASVGIQSFSNRKLRFYGRLNNSDEGEKTLEDVKSAGFENFNLDLIYGSSLETIEELKDDLKKAFNFEPAHISAYCLTIEDGTEFGSLYRQGKLKLPEDEVLSGMYRLVSDLVQSEGYEHYEISNFSKSGYKCEHNLKYWRSNSYFGFGAGAHSHMIDSDNPWGVRWANVRPPSTYMKNLKDNNSVTVMNEHLTREKSLEDRLLMGLRLSEGLGISQICDIYMAEFNFKKIDYLAEDGFLKYDGGYIKLTSKGRLRSNRVILKVLESFDLLSQVKLSEGF